MSRTTRIKPAIRHKGAVLLLVTFSLVVLFGLAALVLDIGRLYIIKTQLQNAADAAALRSALALDTGLGLTASRDKGAEAALKNSFLLVADKLQDNGSDIQIKVGMTPEGPWFPAVGAGNPNGYYFAQATTIRTGIPTFFAGIIGILDENNGASAVAVAGRYHINIMPLAICAPDLSQCPSVTEDGTCGFVPGLSYPVSSVNPIGPGTWFFIDPETNGPGCGDAAHKCKYTSADDMRPYLCAGTAGPAVSGLIGSTVCTNTGKSVGPSLAAIDSRFGDYASAGKCTPEVGPPDRNVMQYVCVSGTDCPKKTSGSSFVADWMQPVTNVVNAAGQALQQSGVVTDKGGDPQPPPMTITTDGVTWSFVRPTAPLNATRAANASYPASGTPYSQTAGKYHADPPAASFAYRQTGRRILDMLIIQCHTAGGVCRDGVVQGIGEFLLTRKTADNDEMYVEFSRIVSISEFPTEIKLYQ